MSSAAASVASLPVFQTTVAKKVEVVKNMLENGLRKGMKEEEAKSRIKLIELIVDSVVRRQSCWCLSRCANP